MGGRTILFVLGVLAAAAACSGAAAECRAIQIAEIPVTMDGVQPIATAKINGKEVSFITDSGAFYSMLTPEAAERLGLSTHQPPPWLNVVGVTGGVATRVATADTLSLGAWEKRKVDFIVGGSLGRNADGLFGQNLLGMEDAEYDFANGKIRLLRPQGCRLASLAYWAGDNPVSVIDIQATDTLDQRIQGLASVNGQWIRVQFDTGAGRSVMTLKAALRFGIKPTSPGVRDGGLTRGIGRKEVESWIAPFDSFAIGGEEIKHTHLRIGAIDLGDVEMLIGADFFLSHHVLVSKSQQKLYFTYNGGPVFRLEQVQTADAGESSQTPAASAALAAVAAAPTDAGGFSRRAAAFAARGDLVHALADYSRSLELDPNQPKVLFARAGIRLRNREREAAMADLEQALKLKPDYADALVRRGAIRLGGKDDAGARSDFDTAEHIDPAKREEVALAYAGAKRFAAAIGELDPWIAALQDKDDRASALNSRCWLRAEWGQELDKALNDCDAALKLRPHIATFLDSRGLVKVRLGRAAEAVADYTEALKLQPKMAWSLYGRGLAEQQLGQSANAAADLKAATELQPNLPEQAAEIGMGRAGGASAAAPQTPKS